ncbi:WYL domain-containing protein [Sphingomonas sp. BN140010]|uniref:WYL domain-containing protein n=1 Tax=Sphingomonas arvum TaxID=2992113 RepID=A0ABT3JHP3_9SPHN|nr:WYL domain-containing protein [Sphingomonas sp. BN140010]MCW3798469.1 WYL domain-containing protein [Sphingomonas sp. BN140010]
MARADRLMRLMDLIRRLPAPVTAGRLADEMEISPRQLYRDVATLRAGGAIIEGEPGFGYTLTEDIALPPQSFSRLEIEALLLAAQALQRLGDEELVLAARSAVQRIVATLPERQAKQALHAIMRSSAASPTRRAPQIELALVREACWNEEALMIGYLDQDGIATERAIWPLALFYGEDALMLLAQCQLRQDFRIFHVNRISAIRLTGNSFRPRRVALLREFTMLRGRPAAH